MLLGLELYLTNGPPSDLSSRIIPYVSPFLQSIPNSPPPFSILDWSLMGEW